MKSLLNRGLLNRGFTVLQNSLPAFHRSSCLLRIPLPRPLSSPTRSGPPSSPQPAASTHQLPLCTSSRTNVSELFPSGCRHWWWRQGPSEAYQAQQLTLNWVYYWPVGKLHLSRHMDYPHGPEWWVVNWSCCNRWFVRLEELPSIFFCKLDIYHWKDIMPWLCPLQKIGKSNANLFSSGIENVSCPCVGSSNAIMKHSLIYFDALTLHL